MGPALLARGWYGSSRIHPPPETRNRRPTDQRFVSPLVPDDVSSELSGDAFESLLEDGDLAGASGRDVDLDASRHAGCPDEGSGVPSRPHIAGVSHRQGVPDLPILTDISFEVQRGTSLTLVGPSGAG